MRRLLATLSAIVILALPVKAQPVTVQQLVPWIAVENSYGSVIILNNREVLTAEHVAEAGNIAWIIYGGLRWRAVKVKEDEGRDIALFRTDVPLMLGPDVLAQCGYVVTRGEWVYSRNLLHEATIGEVYGVRFNQDYGSNLYHSAKIIPGDSGGPVVNAAGHVIGMNVAYTRIPYMSVAVYYESLREFLGQPCR